MEETPAQRIANNIFENNFTSCMDITVKELDEHFKTYSDLTVAQGQIRLPRPGTPRTNIKAFVQSTRDKIRLGRDPSRTPFPINLVSDLVRRYKTHEKCTGDAKTLSEAAKPDKLKEGEDTKWEDWKPTFLNYIRSIQGQDGVPLKYICRINDEPDPTPNDDFLDDYVAMVPLEGDSYAIDCTCPHVPCELCVRGMILRKPKFWVWHVQLTGVMLLCALLNIKRVLAFMRLTFARQMRSSKASSMPGKATTYVVVRVRETTHHTCIKCIH